MNILNGLLGITVILGLVYLFSSNKKDISWKTVRNGILAQIVFAFVLLTKFEIGGYDLFYPFKATIEFVSHLFVTVISFASSGSQFIFGKLADPGFLGGVFGESNGFIFAFNALTILIFLGSLMSVLYYFGVMQIIIRLFAKLMLKILDISGAESVAVAANVFVGQTEAPLVIKPYLEKMTKSEILTVMVGGMATIAGSVMGAYVFILGGNDPAAQVEVAKRLLTASIMAAPATILIAKMLLPEKEHSFTKGEVEINVEKNASNVIESAANGATDGLNLALNVAAMLLAFISLIALLNSGVEWIFTDTFGLTIQGKPITASILVGYIFSAFGFIIGVPLQDLVSFGSMLGEKLILNEFVAYSSLGKLQSTLDPKTIFLSTFAFCGFANLSSIAIQIGGIGSLAPGKRSLIAKYGILAVFGGSLATLLTASIAGMFF
jgi:CNT family concentrative nucleoside transporter